MKLTFRNDAAVVVESVCVRHGTVDREWAVYYRNIDSPLGGVPMDFQCITAYFSALFPAVLSSDSSFPPQLENLPFSS